MLRYTVLRLLIFFGFTLLFWLVGLRDDVALLIIFAALASAITSFFLLRGMRDEMTTRLMDRHEARMRAKAERGTSLDELDEDAEADSVFGGDHPRTAD
jgi:hypothetical protein